MEKSILGRTGLDVTRIGLGGFPIQRLSTEQAVAVVDKALELGAGLIDTARVYTDSEEKIGRARRRKLGTIIMKPLAGGALRPAATSGGGRKRTNGTTPDTGRLLPAADEVIQ